MRSKALMDDLLKQFDAEGGDDHRGMDSENQKILASAGNYADTLANLEDELDELEAEHNVLETDKKAVYTGTMDIERSVQKLIQTPKPVHAPSTGASHSGVDAFIKGLYCRQKDREREGAFNFSASGNLDKERSSYTLDLVEDKARFYYIDVQEDFHDKSRLLVFGKVKVKDRDPVSCCLVVNGMERRYYFFKKENESVVRVN